MPQKWDIVRVDQAAVRTANTGSIFPSLEDNHRDFRYYLIITPNSILSHSNSSVTILPIKSKENKKWSVPVDPNGTNNLTKTCFICCNQIYTLSRSIFDSYTKQVGTLDNHLQNLVVGNLERFVKN